MSQNAERQIDVVRSGFAPARILVTGDLMLDRYFWGEVARISPEAPVPVVRLTSQSERCGGAANVAANLAGLGAPVDVAGFVGHDREGANLIALLESMGAGVRGVVRLESHATVTKTRIIGGHQQMLRLDAEDREPVSKEDTERLRQAILDELRTRSAAVILSDYAKGTLSEELINEVIAQGRREGIPIFVDPKSRDFSKYAGATALTPNRAELAAACGLASDSPDDLLAAGEGLRQRLGIDFIALTRGEEGISLLEPGRISHNPAVAKRVFDVSGAGDTVIAVLAAGIAAGLERLEAIHLANLAAGIVVGKVGTAPIEQGELIEALHAEASLRQASKLCRLDELLERVHRWRLAGERIVFTNGCFDLIHLGHVTFLEHARREGGRLVVGLNTDRSVRALKGPARPVIGQEERARILAALECVDAVVLFDEDTPLDLIRRLRPEVLAKGDEYSEDQVVGADEIKCWNGRLALIPLVPGYSSSKIIEKLKVSAGRPHAERD